MQLIQKKYLFQNSDKVSPNAVETYGLKLVINGINTDIPIEEVIYNSSPSAGYIKGWSLLALLTNPEPDPDNFKSLDLKGNIFEIGFISPTGNFYQIYSIEDPTFQYGPQEIEEAEVDRIIALLQSTQPTTIIEPEEQKTPLVDLVAAPGEPEPEIKEEVEVITEEAPIEQTAEAEVGTDKGGSEIASEPVKAEAEAVPAVDNRPEENEQYTKSRFALEQLGYVEYAADNYKLFGKPESEPYLLVTSEDKVEELAITEIEITDMYADYFTIYNERPIVFRFIQADQTLSILNLKTESV